MKNGGVWRHLAGSLLGTRQIYLCGAVREVVYGLLAKHGRIFSIPKENVQKSLEVQSDGTAVPLLEKERTAYLPYFPSAELSESKVLRDSS